jgi:hypothetical protein
MFCDLWKLKTLKKHIPQNTKAKKIFDHFVKIIQCSDLWNVKTIKKHIFFLSLFDAQMFDAMTLTCSVVNK